MAFCRDGIEDVHACVLPDGIGPDGRAAALSRSMLVTWRSSLEGRLYQVYVNGRLAGVTVDTHQRQMVVVAPSSFEAAACVEVVAVEPREAHVDFADQIEQPSHLGARVRLAFLRSQHLPPGTALDIYGDGGTGQIDYDEPLNGTPIPIWPCPQDKAGFGMSHFGDGDFGWDAAAAVGFGKGCFGYGQFGLDADAIEWISPLLASGTYRFGVQVVDEAGNASAAVQTGPLAVVTPARPAARLDVASFDAETGRLTLCVSDQS
ncbi:MAG: hypothetical protein RBS72_04515 [Sedimentisphaerales bacterium]|nr:hypothetical protein [Sedimentisphaerales bacterium]HNY77621.1 hypothetical protein [Sedimentisphaerales bacterium]HOC61954.1 hypothetical protein [Sedimentisphaerales bacterium]HOH63796.1 hypothetical protein [Sedimentisphaerales bacterium]HPY48300.1 hypothetical protein [Sedimentisphaerales bacterium]